MKAAASTLALLLVAASCAGDVELTSPTPPPTLAERREATPPPQETEAPADGPATPTAPQDGMDLGPQPEHQPGPQEGAASSPDRGPVGAAALTYLRGDTPRLVIEVDAVEGREPTQGTVSHLRSSLASVLDKPAGIAVRSTETFRAPKSRYTAEDLLAVEDAHRQTRTSAQEASLYVLYLNGEFAEEDSVLGVSFSASAFAIFTDAVRAAASPLVPASDIERSVTLHEAGHLLRLVNIGYRSPRDREDPQHCNHSRNRGSVMFWAVESGLVTQVLAGPPPDRFDDADRGDLADMKDGRIRVSEPEYNCGGPG